jgi:hypothetical protein
MRIIAIRCGDDPKVEELEHGLEAMQEFVGGYIDRVRLDEHTDLWCNDEGLFTCSPNLLLGEQPIHGNVFIAGHDGEGETIGLTEEQLTKWMVEAFLWPRAILM